MKKLTITFKSLGRSQRQWTAIFDLGDADANRSAALKAAFDLNASIIKVE